MGYLTNLSQFNLYHYPTAIKIDFWINKQDEFGKSKFRRKKNILINGRKITTITAEDLILTKLFWCLEIRSERHLRDCAGIIKTQKEVLDWRYLTGWAKKLGVEKLLAEVKTADYENY